MKTCVICREPKPLTEFNRNRAKKDGHQDQCRQCHARFNATHNAKRQMTHRSTNSTTFKEIPRANFNAQWVEQDFCCAATGRPTSKPVVDHDHGRGGGLRGIVANHINVLLGKHKDSIPSLQEALLRPHTRQNNHRNIHAAIEYLRYANEPSHIVAFTAKLTGLSKAEVIKRMNEAVKEKAPKAKNKRIGHKKRMQEAVSETHG